MRLRPLVAALSWRTELLELLPKLAVSVAVWFVKTDANAAVKDPFEAFSGMVIVAGTTTDVLLLDKATITGPLDETAPSFTMQISVPASRAGVWVAQ